MLRAGQKTDRQMDHGGRGERHCRVFRDVQAYVSCRGYAGIPQGRGYAAANQGGTADRFYSSLTELGLVCQGRFVFQKLECGVNLQQQKGWIRCGWFGDGDRAWKSGKKNIIELT